MSSVPTATERSPCPPGFSLAIIAAQTRSGSRLSPASSCRLCRIGFEQPRSETLADQAALPVASVGVESVADDAVPIANDIGHERDQARGHLGKVDIGVAYRRSDGLGDFADVDDADRHDCQAFAIGAPASGRPRTYYLPPAPLSTWPRATAICTRRISPRGYRFRESLLAFVASQRADVRLLIRQAVHSWPVLAHRHRLRSDTFHGRRSPP